jgi:small subunit ribosomal protein S9
MSILESFHGKGSRKRAAARVLLLPLTTGSTGQFTVNKKNIVDYFPELAAVDNISQPLNLLGLQDLMGRYHIKATVKGGGKSGQRDALRLGLAKALVMLEAKNKPVKEADTNSVLAEGEQSITWRQRLRKAGFLTTDSRKVERKRYGYHKSRKRAPHVKR